jgi:ribonuclease VapC
MSIVVFDASVIIALIKAEPLKINMAPILLGECYVSAVNYSEAAAKLYLRGMDIALVDASLAGLELTIFPFTEHHASLAAKMITTTRAKGLSFADRACLALAKEQQIAALTADTAWKDIDVGVDIVLVR